MAFADHFNLLGTRRDPEMLVLSRKPGEKIHIGPDVTITVLEVQGSRVRVGVEAPAQVAVARTEPPKILAGPASRPVLAKPIRCDGCA